ncbi:MAG: hypothetical protein AAGC55_31050, partial [Myxococcota bacterium]
MATQTIDSVPGPSAPRPADNPDEGMWHEPLLTLLARRAITIPGCFLIAALYLAILPLALLYSIPADLIRRQPMLLTRFHLTMVAILLWHLVGLVTMFMWWIAGGRWLGLRPKNWRDWNRGLEGWWGCTVIRIAEWFYRMRMDIRGDEQLLPGPVLIFARHTSVIDT